MVAPFACGNDVCFTVPDTKLLDSWIASVLETRRSLISCPLVTLTDK